MTATCWYPNCSNSAPHADDRALAIHFVASHIGNLSDATAEPSWLDPLLVHDIKLVNEGLREDVTRDAKRDLEAWRVRLVENGILSPPEACSHEDTRVITVPESFDRPARTIVWCADCGTER